MNNYRQKENLTSQYTMFPIVSFQPPNTHRIKRYSIAVALNQRLLDTDTCFLACQLD